VSKLNWNHLRRGD